MMSAAPRTDGNLPELLVAHARSVSDGRLVADVLCGCVVLGLAIAFRPFAWLSVAGAGGCLISFGLWGVFDREVGEREHATHSRLLMSLRIGRALSATLGAVAGVILVFGVLGVALGTWVS
jgi:hypothetical protein